MTLLRSLVKPMSDTSTILGIAGLVGGVTTISLAIGKWLLDRDKAKMETRQEAKADAAVVSDLRTELKDELHKSEMANVTRHADIEKTVAEIATQVKAFIAEAAEDRKDAKEERKLTHERFNRLEKTLDVNSQLAQHMEMQSRLMTELVQVISQDHSEHEREHEHGHKPIVIVRKQHR